MPRTVIPAARAALLAALLAALVGTGAAPASAESLALSTGSDPTAGRPNEVDYEYDTGTTELSLVVIARPASGPPCQPTSVMDQSAVGSGGFTPLTPTPIMLNGIGGDRLPYTFPSAGTQRLCAWLSRTPDDPAAAAARDVEVRAPVAQLTATAEQADPKAGGSELRVHVSGTVESSADLFVTAVEGPTCPAVFDEQTDPRPFETVPEDLPTRVSGTFSLDFRSSDLLSFRRWTVCAYLQDGVTATTATATSTSAVDFVLKPQLLRRPRVKATAGALSCDGGRWKSRPKEKLSFAWLKGGKPIPGAKARRLKVTAALRGKKVACRVTAKNTIGTARGTSKAVKAR